MLLCLSNVCNEWIEDFHFPDKLQKEEDKPTIKLRKYIIRYFVY